MDHGVVRTVDYHTGGEPFRIVTDPGPIAGVTVADKRVTAMSDPRVDGLRRLLCFEPRGHADMYGGFLVPPDDDGAHLGVLFWHKDGFSTACGHGTIALGAWAVRSGLVPVTGDRTDVIIDVPSGRVTARVHTGDGRVDFVNVPSYLIARDVEVGEYRVDVSFGGAIYAQVDASSLGLTVTPESYQDLIAVGREIKWALNDSPWARHPSDDRLSGVYGTIVYEELGPLHHRNVTIFADGELDRSPCGSGTAARVATLAATGRLTAGQTFTHDSIVGSRFTATIASETTVDGHPAVVPCITGSAYPTGEHTFFVDPADDLPGFVLR
ncbi:MAG: proline racemase [Hamadaea sp.]|nr:proline racemase [Hamadaea sp.]